MMRRASGARGWRARTGRATRRARAPLSATAASQPLTAAYALRKVNPDYTGAAVRVLDSINVAHDVGFDAQGNLDTSGFASWGNGTSFRLHSWYDQSGNGHHAPPNGVNYPLFRFEGPGLAKPYVDFTTRYMACLTANAPLHVGGTRNLSILTVFNTRGWSSAGTHSRDPAVHGSIYGPVVGYGTAYGNGLLYGARGANAETVLYTKEGELLVDASTDFSASRWRNVWFNQKGALVSGGGDVRQLFSGRAHGLADYPNSKIILGNHGGTSNSHNGGIREVLIYNNAAALTDEECQRIALAQRAYWADLAANRYPERYLAVFSGQSNAEYYGRDAATGGAVAASGDGSANSNALVRVFTPALKAALSFPKIDERELATLCTTTAFGGSSMVKRAQASNGYWWDQDTASDGPRLTSWKTGVSAALGKQFRKVVILWSQGETDAAFLTAHPADTKLVADWKAQTKLVWAAMRAHIGYDCPILIQPLGNYAGNQAAMTMLRAVQVELSAEVSGVTIGDETTDLTLQDSVHFAAKPSTTGFDLGATRLAAKAAPILENINPR